ncbi:hypothetical protein R1sor_009578 [Riccia sorocarpa]|uniref:Uncharacterized protein n=1 Tax=Riccia sorocarpa TaxID=122646 RepID=A0ABD3HZ30_9MARC
MTRRKAAEAAKNSPFASTPPQAPGPMEGIQGEIPATEKVKPLRSALKEKGKASGYKLAADIETSTNLKGMLDHVMDAKIEFTLRDMLGIAKREFHDLIIDIIKRKRETILEPAATQLVEVMDLATEDDDGYHHLAFVTPSLFDLDDNEGDDGKEVDSDYRREHWAIATEEVQVKLGGLEEAVTALVDNGFEINIMSKELYDKGLVGVSSDTVSQFTRLEDLCRARRKEVLRRVHGLRSLGVLAEDEDVSCVFEEILYGLPCEEWLEGLSSRIDWLEDGEIISLPSQEVYKEVVTLLQCEPHPRLETTEHGRVCWCGSSQEAEVHTKYKSVMKKVKPMAVQLPQDSHHQMEIAATEPVLRDVKKIGHKFTPDFGAVADRRG